MAERPCSYYTIRPEIVSIGFQRRSSYHFWKSWCGMTTCYLVAGSLPDKELGCCKASKQGTLGGLDSLRRSTTWLIDQNTMLPALKKRQKQLFSSLYVGCNKPKQMYFSNNHPISGGYCWMYHVMNSFRWGPGCPPTVGSSLPRFMTVIQTYVMIE